MVFIAKYAPLHHAVLFRITSGILSIFPHSLTSTRLCIFIYVMEASTHIKFLVWILLYLLIPIKGELNTEVIQFDASNFSDFMYDKKAELKYGNFVKLNGKRFKMNAFKVVPFVKKKNQCIKECLSEETCKSINVAEVDSEARKYDCHLLDSHIFDPVHYKEIEDAPRHDHFTMKVSVK